VGESWNLLGQEIGAFAKLVA